ncbi:hypothetical protein [Microcoleus sp. S13_C5]
MAEGRRKKEERMRKKEEGRKNEEMRSGNSPQWFQEFIKFS